MEAFKHILFTPLHQTSSLKVCYLRFYGFVAQLPESAFKEELFFLSAQYQFLKWHNIKKSHEQFLKFDITIIIMSL